MFIYLWLRNNDANKYDITVHYQFLLQLNAPLNDEKMILTHPLLNSLTLFIFCWWHNNRLLMTSCVQSRMLLMMNYNDIMGVMASQITSLRIVCSTFIQAQITENIKVLCHWPLCGKFTGDWWIPLTNGHHGESSTLIFISTKLQTVDTIYDNGHYGNF